MQRRLRPGSCLKEAPTLTPQAQLPALIKCWFSQRREQGFWWEWGWGWIFCSLVGLWITWSLKWALCGVGSALVNQGLPVPFCYSWRHPANYSTFLRADPVTALVTVGGFAAGGWAQGLVDGQKRVTVGMSHHHTPCAHPGLGGRGMLFFF